MKNYPNLFSPYTIKKTTFKNRVFIPPVIATRIALNGAPTAEGIDVYENRARGGAAQVTITETFVDFEYASRHAHGLDVVSPNMSVHHMESIFVLTEAIKMHGAVASIQLNHVGATNHPDCIGGKNPIGPSAFTREDGVVIDEMDEAMMDRVADNFANACGNVRSMGFDMVMLHGGHGWLLSQFLSPLSNKRTDKYGGSLENRARFPLMALDRVRAKVGPDFLIEYRISGDEMVEGGMHLDETIEFCKMLEGKVDLLHVTSGIYHKHVETKAFSSMFHPHGCNVNDAAAIKKAVNIPVVVVGGINDPELAEDIIKSGKADFVALGRQVFADPEWARKAMTGRADEIAPCLRCSCFNPLPPSKEERTIGASFMCTVNPWASRELRLRNAPQPRSSKNVLVIGGGAAGMYAAITAAERGHKVTLAEKESALGGHLKFTDHDMLKDDLRRFKNSLIVRMRKTGVKVELSAEVTPGYIALLNPDAVICAVGSVPIVPKISGIETAVHALEAYGNTDKLGKNVVIIGGGLVGCETGLYLAECGKSVHIVEMMDKLAPDANESHKRALFPYMDRMLTYETGQQCKEITNTGITVVGKDGNEKFIEADSVVYAIGMRSRADLVKTLGADVNYFVPVGDCVRPAKVLEATHSALFAALDIL